MKSTPAERQRRRQAKQARRRRRTGSRKVTRTYCPRCRTRTKSIGGPGLNRCASCGGVKP